MTTLRRLISFIIPSWHWVLAAVLLGALTVGAGIGLLATSAYLISAAALHPSIAELQIAIVGVRFFGISRGVFRYLERLTSHSATFRLLGRLRVWFYRAVEPLAPARLIGQRSGDLLSRAIADIETLENFYVRVLAPPLVAVVVIVGMSLFMRAFDPRLATVLLAFLLLIGLGLTFLTLGLGRAPGRTLVESRARLRADLVDGLQGLPDLLAYAGVEAHLRRVQSAETDLHRAQRKMAHISSLQSALNNLLTNLGVWLVLILAIMLVSAGKIDGVYLAVIALAAMASFEAVQGLPQASQFLESNLQAARRLFEIADAAPAVIDPPAPLPLPRDIAISVRGLCFAYPASLSEGLEGGQSAKSHREDATLAPALRASASAGENAKNKDKSSRPLWLRGSKHQLENITFDLPVGKHLVILGPSGAGKSTLVNLLLRFWNYDEGEIILGSQDIRQYQQEDIRRCFSVVSQSTYLFNDTLAANLRLAKPDATDDELTRAVEQAQLSAFVASLPQGLLTFVGEYGWQLSGGERQRLAIARALLKDAPIFIFDEPTANLDTVTERQIIETLHGLMKGHTVLWITHRMVGMERMDEILVMDQGRILQRGTHAELVKSEGLYRQMWEIQN
ncbi:MAG: thiol reductant ABC exporter subunit CydC [Chloroflexi bacterium]|nr:thiol reductant ABC exporter subunit CydC [Chloroflexota bacterium]